MQKVELMGFMGVMGGGKDYNAKILVKEHGFTKIDFKDALLAMAWDVLGWQPKTEAEYEKFKKSTIKIFDNFILGSYHELTGREFLQKLGTDAMRNVDKDFWVKAWKKRVDLAIGMGNYKICTADIRFMNELKQFFSIYDHNYNISSQVRFCDYKSERYNAENEHESEQFAQKLLKAGYQDGDLVTLKMVSNIFYSGEGINVVSSPIRTTRGGKGWVTSI